MFKWFQNLASPFPETLITTPSKNFWTFAWACTQGLRPYLLGMTIFTGLIAAFEAALFAMMGKIVDWLSSVPKELLWQQYTSYLSALALILILSTFFIILQTMFKHQTLAANFPMRMRWNFHRLMLNQSMSFYQEEFAGRVSAKVMQTALAVRDVWFVVADIMVYVVVYFGSMVGIVAYFNSLIAIPFLVWLTTYIASLSYFVPRLSKTSRMQADARSLMTGRITDAYTNISTVKLFSHAGRESGYAKDAMQEFIGTVHAQMQLVSMVEIINHALNMLLIIATGLTALYLWSKGQVSVGGVAAATAMSLRLNGISHWVMWEMTTLYEQIGTVQDGMNTLTMHNNISDAPDAKPLQVKQGGIKFDAVDFSYGGSKIVLKDLNLNIKPGEKVGLVGRSGAGKSTIVNLLLRFYEVEQGGILIDDQNVNSVTQNSLRENIGMVTQDTSLLHRSVRDNILYGRPDATEAEMINAAKRAEAHDFILSLQDAKGRTAYDAHVGERGVKLSGGQRQRIAIARVMLKDAPILLLDEATSALDSEVEQAIQASLYNLMQGKTVVAIAHRLSTIAAMDRLIVLDEGKIVEEGNHQELLKQGGLYASLWAHQSGGFLGE
ncbi:MAG: ABC transporter ATP-binding protein [Methylotenera sp.]|uniref:ABC transporter ATP-binding protein n=1 Tax=Methylotenera sp. TaxID=2051956 RepID=UPI00248A85B9|nr:ABC transporter ATP-binding protein [Methylotenera sp.]MDI1309619.1 ABC transporter ATP-binding protein [Methylotenera sp.]